MNAPGISEQLLPGLKGGPFPGRPARRLAVRCFQAPSAKIHSHFHPPRDLLFGDTDPGRVCGVCPFKGL